MRSVEIVKVLPRLEFPFQVNTAFVRDELIELLLVSTMLSLDFAIELG